MSSVLCKPAAHRFSIQHAVKPVNFRCLVAGAQSVSLVGDFNAWQSYAHPMRRQPDGTWFIQVPLPAGHHRYRFEVDGRPVLDPNAIGVTRDDFGEPVSLLAVS